MAKHYFCTTMHEPWGGIPFPAHQGGKGSSPTWHSLATPVSFPSWVGGSPYLHPVRADACELRAYVNAERKPRLGNPMKIRI